MRPAAARSALAAGAVAACAIGMVGVEAGLLWIVAGVYLIRWLAGTTPGATWAVACIGAGLRWGTFGLADLETATRLLGPTVVTGATSVRWGMTAALVAAVIDVAGQGGLLHGSLAERIATAVAAVVLVPLFVVRGPTQPSSALTWAAAGAAVAVAVLLLRPVARRVPQWFVLGVAAAGVIVAEVGG